MLNLRSNKFEWYTYQYIQNNIQIRTVCHRYRLFTQRLVRCTASCGKAGKPDWPLLSSDLIQTANTKSGLLLLMDQFILEIQKMENVIYCWLVSRLTCYYYTAFMRGGILFIVSWNIMKIKGVRILPWILVWKSLWFIDSFSLAYNVLAETIVMLQISNHSFIDSYWNIKSVSMSIWNILLFIYKK